MAIVKINKSSQKAANPKKNKLDTEQLKALAKSISGQIEELAKTEALNSAEQKIRAEEQELAEKDRELALEASGKAAQIQGVLSWLKESASNVLLKSFALPASLKQKINKSKPKKVFLGDRKTSVKYDADGVAKSADKVSWGRKSLIAAKTFFGEAVDEGIVDPFTEDFSKGYAISSFNNTVDDRYDAEKYSETGTLINNIFSILDNVGGGFKSVADGFLSEDNIYEGLIGGLSGIKPTINWQGLASPKPKDFDTLPWHKKIQRYVTNEIISDIQEAEENLKEDKEIAKVINSVIAKNKKTLLDMNSFLGAISEKESAVIDGDYLKSKDSKLRVGFEGLFMLNEFMEDQLLQNSPTIQQAYQQIKDIADGKITDEQINAHLKDVTGGKPATQEQIEKAKEKIQNDGKELLRINEIIKNTLKSLNESEAGANLSDNAKKQLVFNKVIEHDINARLKGIEKNISGREEYSTTDNPTAMFNTEEGYNIYVDAQTDIQKSVEEAIQKTKEEIKELEEKENLSEEEAKQLQNKLSKLEGLELHLDLVKEDLEIIKESKDAAINKTLSKEEILQLNPEERAMILDSKRLHLYSKKQQRIIKELLTELKLANPDIERDIQDAGTLYRRKKSNQEAFSRVYNNQALFENYVEYKESSFANQAEAVARRKIIKDYSKTLDNIGNDLLQQVIIGKGFSLDFVKDYRKYSKNKETERDQILDRIEKILSLYGVVNKAIDKSFDEDSRKEIKELFIATAQDAKSVSDLLRKLEKQVDYYHEIDPELSNNLNSVLEHLANANYQRNTKILKQREKRREEERKRKEEERKAKEEIEKKEKLEKRRGHKQIERAKKKLEEAETPLEKANAISNFNGNVYHGAEATEEEKALFEKATKELEEEGYEVVNMLGKSYHEGMKVRATFVEDESLKPGEQIITKVHTPQVNKDGKMIQAAEVIVSQGPEKSEQSSTLNEENKDTDTDNSPSMQEQAKELGIPPDSISDSSEEDFREIGITEDYVGNIYPGFDTDILIATGKLQRKRGSNKKDIMNVFYDFLNKKKIRLQDIIDFELGNIFKKYPDVKVYFATPNSNDSTFNKFIFSVIEYTEDIKKLHNESLGGTFVGRDGKTYLIIGAVGTQFKDSEDNINYNNTTKFLNLVDKIRDEKTKYFENSEHREDYYVSTDYTQIKEVKAGQRVTALEDEDTEIRTLSELMYDEEGNYNEERNPLHLGNPANRISGYASLSWFIQKRDNYLPINTGTNRVVRLSSPDKNNGSVFLLIKGADGTLIPTYIKPVFYNEIKEGALKKKIDKAIEKLVNPDLEARKKAKDELRQFLVLSEENNIAISDERGNPVLSLMRNGTVVKGGSFTIDKDFSAIDFITAIQNFGFRINVTASVLSAPSLIAEYDEAGVFKTDLAMLAFRNASYTLYDVSSEGTPIINDAPSYKSNVKSTNDNSTITSVQYGNKQYRIENGVYRDDVGNVVTDKELIRKLQYVEITKSLTPVEIRDGYSYFILDYNKDNPVALKIGRTNDVVIATKEEAAKLIEKVAKDKAEKEAAEAAKEELKKIVQEGEDVDIPELGDNSTPPPTTPPSQSTEDVVQKQMLGDFSEQSSTADQTKKTQQEPKQNPVKDENKPVKNLENSNSLTTFASVYTKTAYKGRLFKIFKEKGWEWSGKQSDIEKILEEHKVPLSNISNIETWLEIIKNCR